MVVRIGNVAKFRQDPLQQTLGFTSSAARVGLFHESREGSLEPFGNEPADFAWPLTDTTHYVRLILQVGGKPVSMTGPGQLTQFCRTARSRDSAAGK